MKHKVLLAVLAVCLVLVGVLATWKIQFSTSATTNGKKETTSSTETIPDSMPELEPDIRTTSSQTSSEPEQTSFKIAIAGDSMFILELIPKLTAGLDPFAGIQPKWSNYDARILNLETNISTAGQHTPADKNFTFNSTKQSLEAMRNAQIDFVSLANNHAMDYRASGLLEQMRLLKNYKIGYFGAGENLTAAYRPGILKLGDNTVAFVGLNDIENLYTNATDSSAGTAPFNWTKVEAAINNAKNKADIVIVYPHWGVEHQPNQNSEQVQFAHRLIDLGADLVVGAHPHVVQGHEVYQGKDIYYSLGNFIFVGMWDRPNAMRGQYLEIDIENKQITGTNLIDYYLNSDGVPTFDVEDAYWDY